jgi:hypothetical protein
MENTIEQPSAGRSKIKKNGSALTIQIPSRKNWFIIIFLGVWLGGWVMGESFALGSLFLSDVPLFANGFILVWLTAWTIGGFFAITIFFWQLVGKEVIAIDNQILTISKYIFHFHRGKNYDIKYINNLEINSQTMNYMFGANYANNFFGMTGGSLKFDYGMKTIKFAGSIDEAEARMILENFKQNPNFSEKNFFTGF